MKSIVYSNNLSLEQTYQEIRLIQSLFLRREGDINFEKIRCHLLNLFDRFSINVEQHEKMIYRIFKTFDFFPLAYEYYMTSIESEKVIMNILRLPTIYCKWIKWFELFRNVNISDPVMLKDFLETLQGNYDVAIKFCLYFEVYNINNGYNIARSSILNLKEKALYGDEEPFLVTHLAIRGRDLADKGLSGRQIGVIMREILQNVKADPSLNTKNKLLNMVKMP